NITTSVGYLDPSVQYSANTMDLTLRRNDVDFRTMGTRGNQTAVALVLNQLVATATGGLASVVNNVYDLTDGDGLDAMDSMTGVVYQFGARLGLDASRAFTSAAMRRLSTVTRAEERPLPSAGFGVAGTMTPAPGTSENRYGAWFSGFGGVTRYYGSSVDASAKAPSPGVIGGFDAALTDTISLGVSGGRAWPEVTLDGRPDRGTSKVTHAGLYGRYGNGVTRIDAALGFSRVDQEGFRTMTDGVGTVAAESSSQGNGVMFHVEYGRSFELGRGFSVEPGAGLQLGQLHLDGFVEQGGDVLALNVPARTAKSQRLLTGGRVGKTFGSVSNSKMMVEARAAWAHEFRALDDVNLRFSADPFANEFALAPSNDQRDSAVLGFSFAADPGANFRLFVDVGGEVGGTSRIWSGMIGLTRRW
ncbi:MAG: autotransporter outer membrane beta-barrel domain-containing protein, partial [Acidobacteriota bacterium]